MTLLELSEAILVGFSDSDDVRCIDDVKSTSDYIFMMVGGVVSC